MDDAPACAHQEINVKPSERSAVRGACGIEPDPFDALVDMIRRSGAPEKE